MIQELHSLNAVFLQQYQTHGGQVKKRVKIIAVKTEITFIPHIHYPGENMVLILPTMQFKRP